jgi:hypothetical protein
LFAGRACAVYSTSHIPRPTFHVPHSYTLSPSEVPRSLSNDRREWVVKSSSLLCALRALSEAGEK